MMDGVKKGGRVNICCVCRCIIIPTQESWIEDAVLEVSEGDGKPFRVAVSIPICRLCSASRGIGSFCALVGEDGNVRVEEKLKAGRA